MRLALASGRLDVDGVLARLSARQLAEWRAFEALEGGIGGRAFWFPIAQLLALLAESRRDPKKRAAPFKPSEFLPWIERDLGEGRRRQRAWFEEAAKRGAPKKR